MFLFMNMSIWAWITPYKPWTLIDYRVPLCFSIRSFCQWTRAVNKLVNSSWVTRKWQTSYYICEYRARSFVSFSSSWYPLRLESQYKKKIAEKTTCVAYFFTHIAVHNLSLSMHRTSLNIWSEVNEMNYFYLFLFCNS